MSSNSTSVNESITFPLLVSPPANPKNGEVYIDSTLGAQVYFNGAWGPLGAVGSSSIVTDWQPYNLVIGVDSGTAPTYGTTTVNSAQWRRVGKNMEIQYSLVQGTGGSAGSGNYLFPLPPGYSIDTTVTPLETGTFSSPTVGSSTTDTQTGIVGLGIVTAYDATNLSIAVIDNPTGGNQAGQVSSSFFNLASNMTYSFTASVPIAGWSANIQTQSYSNITNWNNNLTFGFTNLGTVTNVNLWYRRVGDSMQISGYFEAGTTGTGMAFLNLPLGYTLDTTKISNNSDVQQVGVFNRQTAATQSLYSAASLSGVLVYDGSTINGFYFAYRVSSNTFVPDDAGSVIGSNDLISVDLTIPIAGWAAQSPGVSVGASAYLAASTLAVAADTPVIFDTVFFDTTNSYNNTTGIYTVPVAGIYEVSAVAILNSGSGGGNLYVAQNGVDGSYIVTLSPSAFQSGSTTVQCNVGDTLAVRVDNPVTINGRNTAPFATTVNFILKEGIPSAADIKPTPAVSASTGGFAVVGGPSDTGISCSVINSSSGRVWAIKMQSDGSGNASFFGIGGGGAPESWAVAYIYRNNNGGGPVLIANYQVLNYQGTAGGYNYTPSSSISFEDINPPIGTNVYTISVGSTSSGGATGEGFLQYAVMVVRQVQ